MDVTNKFLVGVAGGSTVIMRPPMGGISKADALMLAAWLVALSDPVGEEFAKVLEAVKSS